MKVVFARCAGLDVSKSDVKACVRVQGKGSRPTTTPVTTWPATTRGLELLRDKLVAERVERVVLESTGDYWRPVFYVLSEALDVVLVRASDVKRMPGRNKTDVSDAEWLADLAAHDLVRASFVPPERQRQLRDLTRTRVRLLQERVREVQRLERTLEDACIKLDTVVSKLMCVSARLMLEALAGHTKDPAVIADLAKGRMRAKMDQLVEALNGRFNDHHAFMLGFHLRRIDQIGGDLDALDQRVEQLITGDPDFVEARDLLLTLPGVGQRGSEELLAEIGPDMSVFDTAGQLASWCGAAPGVHESAGRRKQVKTQPGNRYVKRTLGIAGKSVGRKKDSFLATRMSRLTARRGYQKALVATEHAMLIAAWHMLKDHKPYRDLGGDFYTRRTSQRVINRHIAELQAAGYAVTKAAA